MPANMSPIAEKSRFFAAISCGVFDSVQTPANDSCLPQEAIVNRTGRRKPVTLHRDSRDPRRAQTFNVVVATPHARVLFQRSYYRSSMGMKGSLRGPS